MKNSNNKNSGNWPTILLGVLVVLLSIASCETNGQKSDTNNRSVAPKTTVNEAAFMGNQEAIKAHIKAKSDLNQKDAYGSAPLSIAAVFNKPEIAKLLIEGGADINIKSADGSTPLHSAAFFCRKEIVKMLLDHGADVSLKNNYGATALESVSAPFSDVKPVYDQISKDLGPFGLKLDYNEIENTRPVIAEMINSSEK